MENIIKIEVNNEKKVVRKQKQQIKRVAVVIPEMS